MDRLRELEVFVAVASASGFAKAGRYLRLSPPAVTRAVASLEDRLGTRLIDRTTRSLRLTDAGARFLVRAQRVLADIDDAEKDAVGDTSEPHGHLTVTASAAFGRAILVPIACAFLTAHPSVTITALLLDRVVDLIDEGVDLAIRIGELPDSSLVARRVGTVRRILVASPRYLKRHGAPTVPADLRDHAVIAMTGLMPKREWRYVAGGKARSVALVPRLEVNDALAALAAAEAGDGITIAISYMVGEAIRARRLVPVLDQFAPAPVPVQLVHAQGRNVNPTLRAFIEFSAPRLAAVL
jgi:DNA-binding transcriptional LysR family regulator